MSGIMRRIFGLHCEVECDLRREALGDIAGLVDGIARRIAALDVKIVWDEHRADTEFSSVPEARGSLDRLRQVRELYVTAADALLQADALINPPQNDRSALARVFDAPPSSRTVVR